MKSVHSESQNITSENEEETVEKDDVSVTSVYWRNTLITFFQTLETLWLLASRNARDAVDKVISMYIGCIF
jgi:hypothetical protein